jgi:hypothetical protein
VAWRCRRLVATALNHGVDRLQYAGFRSEAARRARADWLCRRWTGAAVREFGLAFGRNGAASVSNLISRAQQQLS